MCFISNCCHTAETLIIKNRSTNYLLLSIFIYFLLLLAFNTAEPLIIVGDSAGNIHSLKLSPNLRYHENSINSTSSSLYDILRFLYTLLTENRSFFSYY